MDEIHIIDNEKKVLFSSLEYIKNYKPPLDEALKLAKHKVEKVIFYISRRAAAGTYWYHGHAGLSHAGVRGIAGPLLVRPRPSDEVHEGTYTRDLLDVSPFIETKVSVFGQGYGLLV